jgi:hypothetical protein
MSQNILNNSYVIGVAGRNLVLSTLGRVYIKKQDKYYELDFGGNATKSKEENTTTLPDVIVVNNEDDILNMEYPGDGKVIIGADGSLYVTIGGRLVK